MSQIEKLLQKFLCSPQSVRYADIAKILSHLGFEQIPAKGSHMKWKHQKLRNDVVIPIHHNECKEFYKKQTCVQIRILIKK